MYYLRRRTGLDRIQNETIGEMMEMVKDITGGVQKRQLIWFGHTNGSGEMRLGGGETATAIK
jgi:hypothetical protein